MPTFRVLHLSDIHIGGTYKNSEDIAHGIISDLDHNKILNINCIITTGDIFEGSASDSKELIDEAIKFYTIILRELNNLQKKKLSKKDFVFVPGNHDMIRESDVTKQWTKYENFITGFYGNIPSNYDKKYSSMFKPYKDYKIAFLGFNSCQIEKREIFAREVITRIEEKIDAKIFKEKGINKNDLIKLLAEQNSSEYYDFGFISMEQIANMKKKQKKVSDYTIVALFHHHFYLFPEVSTKIGDTGLIRNYSEVIKELKHMNIKTVIHGHKHFDLERPYITDEYYESTESIINIFSGGSVGTTRTTKHTFSVIDFHDKRDNIKLTQRKFIYNNEASESISIKYIPPQNNTSRVINLLELLEVQNADKYHSYITMSEKLYSVHDDCNKIIEWLSRIYSDFNETHKILNDEDINILYILYAVNYRTLNYKKLIKNNDEKFKSQIEVLKKFYKENLNISGSNFSIEDFHNIFNEKELFKCAQCCDKILTSKTNKKEQQLLSLAMTSIFFTDLFLVFTKYADDFKISIKYKVNIKIEDNKFHENVPAPRIVLESSTERRGAYVQLVCSDATAHKIAVLFIKEFDLMINKYEDYFKIIGLKLYCLLPKINSEEGEKKLDNYNFEAYIPTLLPLLTGDNIYPLKETFARELIQNSIDAIAVRESDNENNKFIKAINIKIGVDSENRRFFRIKDHGTGMDRHKIERYFTSIGRSFYSGKEYEELNIQYKPISSFGIGFLSSFMVCSEIDVKTKYYKEDSESLILHIPNYEGCFFIEKNSEIDVGTELILYLNTELEDEKIVAYIQENMIDIHNELNIQYLVKETKKNITIPTHSIRRYIQKSDFKLFIPFTNDFNTVDIDYEEILSGQYISKYKYGILIYRETNKEKRKYIISNAGILVNQASISSLFGKKFRNRVNYYNENFQSDRLNVFLNFPANWTQLDVSRENIVDSSQDFKDSDSVGDKISNSLLKQINWMIENRQDKTAEISTVYFQEIILLALNFCDKIKNDTLYEELFSRKLAIQITFDTSSVKYSLMYKNSKKEQILIIDEKSHENLSKKVKEILLLDFLDYRYLLDFDEKDNDYHDCITQRNLFEFLENFFYRKGVRIEKSKLKKYTPIFKEKLFFDSKDNEGLFLEFFTLLIIAGSSDKRKNSTGKFEKSRIYNVMEDFLLKFFILQDISDNSKSKVVNYDEIYDLFPKEILL